MRVWLDDLRPAPDGWVWAQTAVEAYTFLIAGNVTEISLDHDLGDGPTGYNVACYIERGAVEGWLPRLVWYIHSLNMVGVANMRTALENADRSWNV